MATHLSSGKVNFGNLRDAARRELLECLDKCPGYKALVWDEQLTGPLGLIAEYALLKEHDVTRMFQLKGNELPQNNVKHIIFLTRPKLSLMELIAENVFNEEKRGEMKKEFHIIFVPRKSLLCEKLLKDRCVYGNFTYIDEYCVELFPFDSDLLSMEMENAFKDCVIDKDMTTMYFVAKTLMTLQSLYGIIPNIYVKGHCGKAVLDTLQRMRRELAGNEPQITPQIDNLLLLDRSGDLLTPLVTQLTYEGLIDEIYGLNNTTVKLPPEKFAKPNQEVPSEQKLILNSAEELYVELRDKNFNAIGPALSKKAKLINAQFEERHEAKTVGEIKQFVTKLPHLQAVRTSVATHTSIAELIKEFTSTEEFLDSWHVQQEFINGLETDKINSYIEECIAKQVSLPKVLRLICMQSVTNSGLPKKVLDYYKHEIIQSYGYYNLLTLHNLEMVGLLRLKTNAVFGNIRKTLKLTVEDVNEQNPTDIAYVYSGYAPLSVRLAQFLHRPGWRAIQEVLELLPGERKEFQQKIDEGLRKRRNSGSSTHSGTEEQKVTLVFFLGGVTYAEISALRFLSQLEDAPTEYIIATTKLINGTTFIESLMENFPLSDKLKKI